MYQSIKEHITKHIHPSQNELEIFTSMLSEVHVSKRKFLLQPGTSVNYEYFVVKGCLEAYYIDVKGNRHIVQFAIENWWIGDFDAFYNHIPSKLYIEAIEDATLFAISNKDLEQLFKQAPIFERYFRILITSAYIGQSKRILSSLEKDTKERYLEFCNNYPSIEHRVPNYHIANYLGVSAERLSRIRHELKLKFSKLT